MNVAIIAAAGKGSRMGDKRPKQFLELAGIPIIFHTLRAFEQCEAIQQVVLVLPAAEIADFLSIAAKHDLRKLDRVVTGGKTRADSVWRGLQTLRSATTQIVAVHDGVRAFVTPDEISRTVKKAEEVGAAVLVAPVTDTIKQVEGERIRQTLDRRILRRALTPQCFRYDLLRRAFDQADVSDPEITDESVLVERLGVSVALVEGSARNIKITSKEDLVSAEVMLRVNDASIPAS
jgi:2-C-methyl-D-erythritol 4-phosphate cytidylyltransferase